MPSAANTAETDSLPAAAFFSVYARAEPGTMPRVLEHFAKRGLVPASWRSIVSGPGRAQLTIEIEVAGLDDETAEYIAACLRQIVSVDAVLSLCRDHRH
jgi:acetolactate synthase small subunit